MLLLILENLSGQQRNVHTSIAFAGNVEFVFLQMRKLFVKVQQCRILGLDSVGVVQHFLFGGVVRESNIDWRFKVQHAGDGVPTEGILV